MDQICQNWFNYVEFRLLIGVFLYGFVLGWLCFLDQSDTSPRLSFDDYRQIQSPHLCCLFYSKLPIPSSLGVLTCLNSFQVYGLGTLLSMQIPFVGFQPVQSSEHMAAFAVFGLCQLVAFNDYLKSKLNKDDYGVLFRYVLLVLAVAGFSTILLLTILRSEFLAISIKRFPFQMIHL